MRTRLFLSLICFLIFNIQSVEAKFDLLKCLKKTLPDATITKLDQKDHFTEIYDIRISQPLDHNNPAAGSFEQKIYLFHHDRKSPMVYVTEGYNAPNRTYELSKILRSNQLSVEYRYTGDSKPTKTDWQYLTNAQAIEDLHRIRKLFRKIYRKKWVATGISKGGSTTLIYKAKYPKDVKVAVPYVAPLATAQEDKRTDEHILSVGEAACRSKLEAFQKQALSKRDEILPLIEQLATKNKLSFSMGLDRAFEFAVLEFTFSFWQWGHKCEDIPKPDASAKDYFNYLNGVVGFNFYSDATYDFFLPSFYQFLTELGYYGFIKDPFLDDLNMKDANNVVFGPKDADLTYRPTYVKNVLNWLETNGDNILYIYGEYDPWTACGIFPSKNTNSVRMDKKGGSHSTRISSFDAADQKKIYALLKEWLKVPVYPLD